MNRSVLRIWSAAGLLTLLVSGCGPDRPEIVPVSGQVLINGQPLAAGVPGFVQVVPANSRAATGAIDPKDGTFTLTTFEKDDGCLPGTHPVAVIVNGTAGGESYSLIPEHYADVETSGLTVTIDGPTTDLKIELSGELQSAPAPSDDTGGDSPGIGY